MPNPYDLAKKLRAVRKGMSGLAVGRTTLFSRLGNSQQDTSFSTIL